ncbi:filamentous hemagglutinin N-terminal domain-containing protein [Leptolyngbya sp. FACHB-321]|uniref:two-partner secretion domain-containing protein n=1 Tax=Leptolyngbya sp. FACHB-321 TaxID=2692807 RepID=UPI001683EE7E|nr:filamentous hemagglutinin N-terminal domain-containing protein [Leptolyngbya sp. FACHB-321]
MQPRLEIGSLLLVSTLLVAALPCQAQVTSAIDGTQTIVRQTDNTFNITGGTTAGNNLFHSFQQFGLTQGQVASFLANPAIQNVLGRVTGGEASVINGLLQVTGSNANLYLINPAGIVFGANARLDVAGSFTATTANGIGFGDRWFNAVGANNYATLIGNPSSFAFTMTQPGAIVNAGNLAVGTGQSLTLLGGIVINTGTLTAPEGEVTIAAIPGEKLVRLTPTGSLLSLDLPTATKAAINPQPFNPLTLPELLTGGNLSGATGVTVENGIVTLTGSGTIIPTNAGVAIVSGQVSTRGTVGGNVNVFGQKVGLVGATIDASGTNGGGTVLIGGDYKGQGTLPKAQQTYISPDSIIQADALQTGNGGRAIVWSDQRTEFYGTIRVQGGAQAGDGGFVEVSGKSNLVYQGTVDTSSPSGKSGSLLLDPANILIKNGTGDGDDNGVTTGTFGNNLLGDNGQVQADDAVPTVIYESELEGMTSIADIVLEATNNITIEPLTDKALTIPGDDSSSITFKADSDQDGVGNFVMDQGDSLLVNGRKLTISGANVIAGNIDTMDGFNARLDATVRISSSGNIQAGDIKATDSTKLYTSGGNIKVATITTTVRSGSTTVEIDISTPGLFQATGSRLFAQPLTVVDIDIEENKDIKQFLQTSGILNTDGSINIDKNIVRDEANQPKYEDSEGNPIGIVSVDPTSGRRTIVEDNTGLTASILARDGGAGSQITIRHGGKPVTNNSGFVAIETAPGSNGTAQFIVGPQQQRLNQFEVTDLSATGFVPNSPSGIFYTGSAVKFQSYLPLTLGSNQFPSNVSGTAGTIATDAAQNSNGGRSFPGIPFVPLVQAPTVATGSNSLGNPPPVPPTEGNPPPVPPTEGSPPPVDPLTGLRQRFQAGEDGQVAQRQLNNQKQDASCELPNTIAAAPNTTSSVSETRSPRVTTASTTASNPCASAAQDDAQILKILGE